MPPSTTRTVFDVADEASPARNAATIGGAAGDTAHDPKQRLGLSPLTSWSDRYFVLQIAEAYADGRGKVIKPAPLCVLGDRVMVGHRVLLGADIGVASAEANVFATEGDDCRVSVMVDDGRARRIGADYSGSAEQRRYGTAGKRTA